jgi:hypothetical protein
MSPAKQTFKTILHPNFNTQSGTRRPWSVTNYVLVPRLNTYGTFKLFELTHFEHLAKLAVAYPHLKG